jgi:hypothetical protein
MMVEGYHHKTRHQREGAGDEHQRPILHEGRKEQVQSIQPRKHRNRNDHKIGPDNARQHARAGNWVISGHGVLLREAEARSNYARYRQTA